MPYYLSISSNTSGAKAAQLRTTVDDDAESNILTSTNQGADAAFKLDGITVTRLDNVASDIL